MCVHTYVCVYMYMCVHLKHIFYVPVTYIGMNQRDSLFLFFATLFSVQCEIRS